MAARTQPATAKTVTAPVKEFSGVVVGVAFANGVGRTSDPAALAYFVRHGYQITEAGSED